MCHRFYLPILKIALLVVCAITLPLTIVHSDGAWAETSKGSDLLSPQGTATREDQDQGQGEEEETELPNAAFQELSGFWFYIDPGHGPPNPPGGESCYRNGASGQNTTEHAKVFEIAQALVPILHGHGANGRVYLSRTDDNTPVCNAARANDNNDKWERAGRPSKWRLVSIHLNAPLTDHNRVEAYYSGLYATQAGRDFAASAQKRIETVVAGTENFTNGLDNWVLNHAQPLGDNILTESGHLTYWPFEQALISGGMVNTLAYNHYRMIVDFWIVGYTGPHQNLKQDIYSSYWDNFYNGGIDAGVPFDNGGGYYAHQWYDAYTQEFAAGSGPYGAPYGSILGPSGGGRAFYVPNPIWQKYINKGGPRRTGPGLPINTDPQTPWKAVHSWNPVRGVRSVQFHYPTGGTGPGVVNFQYGAITYNSFESSVFLPNCAAADLLDYPPHWARDYAVGMVKRFAVSNDPYGNGLVNLNEPANRAQLAQSLMFAEGYAPYFGPNLFTDISNHWGRQWINIAASQSPTPIIDGYSISPPCTTGTPCFMPDNTTTRGQFSKMLVLARRPYWSTVTPAATRYDNPSCQSGYRSFADICYGSTFYTYIENAKDHGIIDGYPCGGSGEPCLPSNAPYFRPNNLLMRGQIMKMIDLALPASGSCW